MAKTVQPVARQYAHLDSIAGARRHGDIQRIGAEIRSAEKAMLAQPINYGTPDPHHDQMMSMVQEQIDRKRAQVEVISGLSGDDLVRMYCPEIVAEAEAPSVPVTVNGEPLARGARPQMAPPGMF